MYYIYMLRCEDNSIYTGIAKDLEHRMNEHFSQNEKCAKYTKSRKASKLEIAWKTENKSNASKLEYAIKTLAKSQKENLIKAKASLKNYFENKFEVDEYKKISVKEIKRIMNSVKTNKVG